MSTVIRPLKPSAPNLLITCRGPGAVAIPRDPGRTWDSLELYFDEAHASKEIPRSLADGIVFDPDRTRRKLGVLAALARAGSMPEIWTYDRVCIADDDVSPVGCTFADVFRLFERLEDSTGAQIGQAALTSDSYVCHSHTKRDPRFVWRSVNFVEVMAPIFTRAALARYASFFGETVMCWGFDSVWSARELRAGRPLVILDATPLRHSRPLYSGVAYRNLTESPHDEGLAFMARHGVRPVPSYAFGGVDAFGRWSGAFRCDAPVAARAQECAAAPRWTCVWRRRRGFVCDRHRALVESVAIAERTSCQLTLLEPWELAAMHDPRISRGEKGKSDAA